MEYGVVLLVLDDDYGITLPSKSFVFPSILLDNMKN
jgi:hypothetical protein